MEFPIKAFEINGRGGERVKLDIVEVFGYPDEPSFRGGYDIRCSLEITAGAYTVRTDSYYSATGALAEFYTALKNCYDRLNGQALYNVYCAENDLELTVAFDMGKVYVHGSYREDMASKNRLDFELATDQSYFVEILRDLKKATELFVAIDKR